MHLLALAGGFADAGTYYLVYCCVPIAPLEVLLIYIALTRSNIPAACLALFLVGVPYCFLLHDISNFTPSDDGDVVSEQGGLRWVSELQEPYVIVAGLALLWELVVRSGFFLFRRVRRRGEVAPAGAALHSMPGESKLNLMERVLIRVALYPCFLKVTRQGSELDVQVRRMNLVDRVLLCIVLYPLFLTVTRENSVFPVQIRPVNQVDWVLLRVGLYLVLVVVMPLLLMACAKRMLLS
jgi:hypothetical protein